MPKPGKPLCSSHVYNPHLDFLNMEGTSSTAVVEPKKKSQDPAAKAKRLTCLKRPLANPDFAEAVSFERAAVKKIHDELQILHDEHMVVMKERSEEQAKVIDSLSMQ